MEEEIIVSNSNMEIESSSNSNMEVQIASSSNIEEQIASNGNKIQRSENPRKRQRMSANWAKNKAKVQR